MTRIKKLIRSGFFISLVLGSAIFFLLYLQDNLYRSRADNDPLAIQMLVNPSTTELQAEGVTEAIVSVIINATDQTRKISGIDLRLYYNEAVSGLVRYQAGTASVLNNALETKVIEEESGANNLRLVFTSNKPDSELPTMVTVSFKVSLNAIGADTINLKLIGADATQIVGITGSSDIEDMTFALPSQNITQPITVTMPGNGGGGGTPGTTPITTPITTPATNLTPTNGAANPTPTGGITNPTPTNGAGNPTPTSGTNNPTPTNGANLTPTEPVEPIANNTPTGPATTQPVGNTKLNLALTFQGIQSSLGNNDQTTVKVTVKRASQTVVTRSVIFSNSDEIAPGLETTVWNGSLSADLETGANYSILVKGPTHLQKKICVADPAEAEVGRYRCGNSSSINITSGQETDLDFTGITMMVGDLPLESTDGQDGICDAIDMAYIQNNLGKNENALNAIGDLNRNGGIAVDDLALIKYSLRTKPDDE